MTARRRAARGLALAAALGSCADDPAGDAPPPGADDLLPPAAWTAPIRLAFDARGVTPEVTWSAGESFVSLSLDDPTRCVQVETARLGATPVVAARSTGAFCAACPERVSAAVGGGLFALPSGARSREGALTLSFGLRDCATWAPAPRGDAALGAEVRATAAAAPSADLALRVDVLSFGDAWTASPDAVAALLRAARAELADARIELRPAARCAVPAAPAAELAVVDHAHAEIARWLELARARCPAARPSDADPRATVVVAPCVRRRDRLLGASERVDGYATHVPGGAASGRVPDAVLLSAGCGATLPLVDGAPLGLGRTLAHELGHFLGLYHPVEADGAVDLLDDTTDANLMSATPARPDARGLTPSQVAVARRHPALRGVRP